MKIEDLKAAIENNTVDRFQIWKLTDYTSEVISEQYYKKIAELNNLTITIISDISEIKPAEGFAEDEHLYVFKTEKLGEFKRCDNLIIICNKTDYSDITIIPSLQNWQFLDYLRYKLPGVSKGDLEWLLTQYEQTIDRDKKMNFLMLENDLDKIAIFNKPIQQDIFNFLYDSGEFAHASNLTMFDLTNALVKKSLPEALQVLKVLDYIDGAPHVWLLSILISNFRNILAIQSGNATAEQLGISDKQYYFIKKNNCGVYSNKQLTDIYEMLANAEYMYKFGGLSMSSLSDYIICRVLGA